jgi:uncharacterized protein (TIGR04255 family)
MTIQNREFFSKNKIQEAICQFTFKFELDFNLLNKFVDYLRSDNIYTIEEKLPFIHFNIKFDSSNEERTKQKMDGAKISNAGKDKIIQVFSNNLSIHQVGNYKNWEAFDEDINYILKKFYSVYDIEIARIDLRSINNFDFITLNNINEYFNFNIVTPNNLNGSNKTNTVSITIDQILDNNDYMAIRATYSEMQKKFLLDLNFMSLINDKTIKTSALEDINTILKKGHINLYNTFISSITEKTKNRIK